MLITVIFFMMILGFFSTYFENGSLTSEGYFIKKNSVKLKDKKIKKLLLVSDFTNYMNISVLIMDVILIILSLAAVYSIVLHNIFLIKIIFYGGVSFCLFDFCVLAIIEHKLSKKKKEDIYCREVYDIHEQSFVIGKNEDAYTCIYSESKKISAKGIVLFWLGSYVDYTDTKGNVYVKSQRKGFEVTSNMGVYEELSDCLVREGYATLKIEKTRNDTLFYSIEDIIMQINELDIIKNNNLPMILLLHGPSNRLMSTICNKMNIDKIISLCGACMDCKSELESLLSWKKIFKREMDGIIYSNFTLFDGVLGDKTIEELINELEEITNKSKVFVASVNQDPYYNKEIFKKIEKLNNENIICKYYEEVDFTLRKIQENGRVGLYGYELKNVLNINRLYKKIADDIIEWLRE